MILSVYVANLDSRGMVGTIYEEDHQTLLYSKYNAVGLMVIEDFFLSFPHYMSESY